MAAAALLSFASLILFPLGASANQQQPNPGTLLKHRSAAVQTEWAARYEHGEGVEQSYYWAVRLYCSAAKRGHAPAQYGLGWLYANGRGVERDDALAAAWFRLAAKRGDPQATRMLAAVGEVERRRAQCRLPLATGTELVGVTTAERKRIADLVQQIAPDYELDPRLVLAVIEAESAFNSRARSPKNAQGLMQLIPETAARFGVHDPYNPIQNLHGGMAYLRWLLAYFRHDVRLALAGYNAGERNVEKYRGIPPFAETRAYVAKIMRRYGQPHHPPVEQVVKPSALIAAASGR